LTVDPISAHHAQTPIFGVSAFILSILEGSMALSKDCFCSCLVSPEHQAELNQPGTINPKGALLESTFWGLNQTVEVGFLGGSPALWKRVKEAAKLWISEGGAKIKLVFLDNPAADPTSAEIRISFVPGDGSWSYLGTDAKNIPKTDATMNFGWIDEHSDETELRSVVLHEFGHALGLIHEHQNPNKGIAWNHKAVKADLSGPPNYWDDATIQNNIYKKYDPGAVIETETDKDSIMMYQIPAKWTMDGFSTDFNSTLSKLDKKLMKDVYK
jgi:serralysin